MGKEICEFNAVLYADLLEGSEKNAAGAFCDQGPKNTGSTPSCETGGDGSLGQGVEATKRGRGGRNCCDWRGGGEIIN